MLLSLEMYEDTYLGTADSSVRLVEDIGLDNVGLNPDIGNLIRLHRPIEAWREMVAKTLPYTNYWHMKNYSRDEDPRPRRLPPVPAPMESGLINYRGRVPHGARARVPGRDLHRALRRRRPQRVRRATATTCAGTCCPSGTATRSAPAGCASTTCAGAAR